jgi:hypothetical protein
MLRGSLYLLALTALLSGAASTPAAAGCCSCAVSCAPAPLTIWGVVPSYGVNQGPVYTGPGYTTLPTYEAEVSTIDYPYVGYESDPVYRAYPPYLPESVWPRPLYRYGFYPPGPRVTTVARHWMPRPHRVYRDWR